jgi:hypothetical protein
MIELEKPGRENVMTEMRDITDDGDMRMTLARLLRDAEKEHGQYETTLGHTDSEWPDWYAQYLIDHLPEQG